MKSRTLLPLLLGVWLSLWTSIAGAEGDDRQAYADYLFREGVRLMKNNDCAAAIPKLLSSYRLDPASASLINIGTCYAKMGRTASAWRAYRKAAGLADAEKDAALQAQALEAISVLDPTLTKLKLVTLGKTRPLSLTLNGEPLAAEDGMPGVPIPLDPGENVIEAFEPGHESWRRTVSAREPGTLIVIDVPELARAQSADNSARWRTTGIVVGGIGIASLATGLAFGLSAKQTYDDSAADCDDKYCNARGHVLRARALDRAAVSTVAVGLGVLATAAGVAIWFATPASSRQAMRVVPMVQTQSLGLGLSLEGRL
jgi:tetratricopeptide (TPR) repeat protein